MAPAEKNSEHPLAEAIVAGARERGIELGDAASFEAIAGHGIRAEVDGHAVLVGNRKLMDESGVDVFALEERATALAEAGKTPMFVAVDGEPSGLVAVADTIKPSARETLRRLKQMGIEAVMITGDNKRTAEAVARELGIERVFAEVLPADKARYVAAAAARGQARGDGRRRGQRRPGARAGRHRHRHRRGHRRGHRDGQGGPDEERPLRRHPRRGALEGDREEDEAEPGVGLGLQRARHPGRGRGALSPPTASCSGPSGRRC